MQIYKFSDGREFRLSGTFLDDNGTWQTTVKWIESGQFQNFFSVEVEPFLVGEFKTEEAKKAEAKAEKEAKKAEPKTVEVTPKPVKVVKPKPVIQQESLF